MGKLDVVEVQNYNSRGLISFLEPGSLQLQYRCVKERKKLASPKKKFFYPTAVNCYLSVPLIACLPVLRQVVLVV